MQARAIQIYNGLFDMYAQTEDKKRVMLTWGDILVQTELCTLRYLTASYLE